MGFRNHVRQIVAASATAALLAGCSGGSDDPVAQVAGADAGAETADVAGATEGFDDCSPSAGDFTNPDMADPIDGFCLTLELDRSTVEVGETVFATLTVDNQSESDVVLEARGGCSVYVALFNDDGSNFGSFGDDRQERPDCTSRQEVSEFTFPVGTTTRVREMLFDCQWIEWARTPDLYGTYVVGMGLRHRPHGVLYAPAVEMELARGAIEC